MQNHLEARINFPVSQGHFFLHFTIHCVCINLFSYFPKGVRLTKIPTVTVQLLPQFCSGVIPPVMILDDIPESEQEHSLYSASLKKTKQSLIQQWRHLIKFCRATHHSSIRAEIPLLLCIEICLGFKQARQRCLKMIVWQLKSSEDLSLWSCVCQVCEATL